MLLHVKTGSQTGGGSRGIVRSLKIKLYTLLKKDPANKECPHKTRPDSSGSWVPGPHPSLLFWPTISKCSSCLVALFLDLFLQLGLLGSLGLGTLGGGQNVGLIGDDGAVSVSRSVGELLLP